MTPIVSAKLAFQWSVIPQLPLLPSSVKYYDDFFDTYRTVKNLAQDDKWQIQFDGLKYWIDFSRFDPVIVPLIKHVAAHMLSVFDPQTVANYFGAVSELDRYCPFQDTIISMASMSVSDCGKYWRERVLPAVTKPNLTATLKAFLHSMCSLSVGHWTPEFHDYLSRLPSPKRDSYRVVRTGECFVPLSQQSLVIDFFDELTARVKAHPESVSTDEIRGACALTGCGKTRRQTAGAST